MSAAQTGRTHDLHPTASRKPKEPLDPWAPSTHDPLSRRSIVFVATALKGPTAELATANHDLKRRLPRESWLIEAQPINFIPRSISARMRPRARSTPA
jgi:hypothetical protein